jgi:hypothetical protein
MKRAAVIGFVALVALAVIGWRVLFHHEARLVVENRSGEPIAQLSVTVSNQVFELDALAPGENKEVKLRRYADSAWAISGRWPDGSPIREQAGYITGGMSFDDRGVFSADRTFKFESR